MRHAAQNLARRLAHGRTPVTDGAGPAEAAARFPLPDYAAAQFDLVDPPECDMVMKGGITSGIVYPYAILEIATKYRFRSLGGTSAGAIAAAFAAAAEYGRRSGRKDSFLLLKRYSDELPDKLLSLFQPSPPLLPAVDVAKSMIRAGGVRPLVGRILRHAIAPAAASAALLGIPSWLFDTGLYATILASLLGALVGGGAGAFLWARRALLRPLLDAWRDLPDQDFGFCTGKTQPGHDGPALTDWIYGALQHIAFGDPAHGKPLTFGDLLDAPAGTAPIDLKVVTTNLSMRRPHTLPRLGMAAAFLPNHWDRLFPKAVMDYLYGGGTKAWQRHDKAWLFPREQNLPVVIAVRMSLSFPLLFTAVPLLIKDRELPSIIGSLGGEASGAVRTAHFSDGGISSNFPIHIFDNWLPTRPTFAFSLDELMIEGDAVNSLAHRVMLPETTAQGMGVPVKPLRTLPDFAWQILNSAKDWQDQLLSELTGQRERIARIFLTDREGGLNLDMPPEISRSLMHWGWQAGRKFTEGDFDFDEHRWRRLLVLYRHLEQNLATMDAVWKGGFEQWYEGYAPVARSYKELSQTDRKRIAAHIRALLAAEQSSEGDIVGADRKFPRKAGVLKVSPKY